MLVRIGSRGSRLALAQAEQAAARLRRRGVEVAFVPITTAGDRDRQAAVRRDRRAGVFVKEIEEALLAGRIDVAVHSAKDMTSTDTAGLVVGAYLERDDPRDALSARMQSAPACGSAPRRRGARPSCSRSSRPCRSNRCVATSRRGCGSSASEGSTQSSSQPAASTGSGSSARSGRGSTPTRCFPRRRRAPSPSRYARARKSWSRPPTTPRRGVESSPSARASRRSAPVASRPSRLTTTAPRLRALIAAEDGAWVESGAGDDPLELARRAPPAGGDT